MNVGRGRPQSGARGDRTGPMARTVPPKASKQALGPPPAEAARALRSVLHEHRAESEQLLGLIAAMVSTLDLGKLLRYVADVCKELTGCHGVLVYLWDEDRERLVVRAGGEGGGE